MEIKIVNNIDQAILVMRDAGKWLEESGKKPSKWWQLQNLNRDFLLHYAKPEEFYVALVDGTPAGAMILQFTQTAQEWPSLDNNDRSLYVHWLCVAREFAGQGLPKMLIDFAEKYAHKHGATQLRLDTNASEMKLRSIYEQLGFVLVTEVKEDYQTTALYQKKI